MSLEVQLVLLLWGTLVGLDLVSVPQMMIARPIVAGAGAGLILGDLPTGLLLGTMFELFQYDILPVGAVRYPEYGPATVAAVSAGHLAVGGLGAAGAGLGALVGLFTGMVAGLSLDVLRRVNARVVHAAAAALELGDPAALVRVHVASIVRDAVRAALVTAFGLALAWAVRASIGGVLTLAGVTILGVAAAGAALAAGASGALRLVGRGARLGWLAAGLAGGAAVAWLR